MIYPTTVRKYFKEKAKKYDLVDQQSYWVLSDKLLWNVMCKEVLFRLGDNFIFCDAGGGTGRWSLKILESFPQSKGLTIDASEDMLSQAYEKLKISDGLENRWELLEADLHHLYSIKNNSFDVVFNFHNVLGFVEDPQQVLNELARISKTGGYVISFAPNKYHAIFFNLKLGKVEEAKKAFIGKGKFTQEMPDMHLFSIGQLKDMYKRAGISVKKCLGFPSLIYPGYLETQLHGQTETIASLLENERNFNNIYEMEENALSDRTLAARGNNIFIIGKVP